MYTLQQQVFTLSLLSNSVFGKPGTTQQLQQQATTTIRSKLADPTVTSFIGTWEIVWGPVISEQNTLGTPDDHADNVMVVFKGTNSAAPMYVVAIAATNDISLFDVFDEDVVGPVPSPFSGDAWIAAGTRRGITMLEGMTDPAGGTLQQFLESVPAAGATLAFAGHSLGGALSPTLALDLAVNRGFDLSRWASVYVYPSAGPTPGNQAFSTLFASTFPPVPAPAGSAPWNVWNQDVANTLDIVPHAWNRLQELPSLYFPNLDTVPMVQAIVNHLTQTEKLGTNLYAPLPTSPVPGAWNPNLPPALTPFGRYLHQALYQHILFYKETIIPELLPFFTAG